MSRWTLLTLLSIAIVQPASAAPLTIAQFCQTLAGYVTAHKSDQAIAMKVEALELGERLTPETRERLRADLKLGPKTTLALGMQTDVSAFLEPPASELPPREAPSAEERDRMLRKAVDFASGTMHHMPDFLATRVTRRFDNRPEVASMSGWFPAQTELQFQGTTSQKITYQNGDEVPDAVANPGGPAHGDQSSLTDLTTRGEFGPALVVALTDASHGATTWSHWETIDGTVAAVYRFQVPEDSSHYSVNFCWLLQPLSSPSRRMSEPDRATTNCYRGKPAYHGTLAIAPDSGAIMRITIESELPHSISLARAAMSIQYGAVEIGGRSYICPQLCVAISLVRYEPTSTVPSRSILRINETTFTDYHRFGSTSRIIPDSSIK